MYVLDGRGAHAVGGVSQTLSPGDLLLIRPDDRHSVRAVPSERLIFVNVAFPTESWTAFLHAAGLETQANTWRRAALPPSASVPLPERDKAAGVFRRALTAYHEAPNRLELCRFWIGLHDLLASGETARDETGPPWLMRACRAMRDAGNLAAGLPRLVALSGVSSAHLSRTLKAQYGQTPTEFLNALRIARAAALLATTSQEIMDIALDCGFENLSYFYRLFRRQYGQTPRAYRMNAYRSIAP
jgi:AraC family cel operon transcriptional repressor